MKQPLSKWNQNPVEKLLLVLLSRSTAPTLPLEEGNLSTYIPTDPSRIHKSLPDPLKFRVTFTDIDNGTSVIECECHNTPLELPEPKKICTDYKAKEAHLWATCDDPELEGRIFAFGAKTEDGSFFLKTNDKSVYFYKNTLISQGYQGVKSKQNEIEYPDLCSTPHPLCSIKAYLLVDLENQIAYGIKFVLTTSTSKTIESVVFPTIEK
jgi:hypothetical protein